MNVDLTKGDIDALKDSLKHWRERTENYRGTPNGGKEKRLERIDELLEKLRRAQNEEVQNA